MGCVRYACGATIARTPLAKATLLRELSGMHVTRQVIVEKRGRYVRSVDSVVIL
ncbi:hypothetical protein B0T17DRAFT_544987 [Bombardia bombarda]|uniref:Uncharacterized protein n=1 Tax=Bombardia bombarda TaxID=252184 RepID=A0AA39W9V0_9PEZI|nr:hypothetical protein B0T17DRAFT_544987 [Bombardia bombarda]